MTAPDAGGEKGPGLGQFLLAMGAALAFWWAATEWLAWRLAWQTQLGLPLARFAGLRIYPPWAFLLWWLAYGSYAPRLFDMGGLVGACGGLAAMAVALWGSLRRGRSAGQGAFGSARWARRRDIRRARLFEGEGVVLGQFEGRLVRHDGSEHVICVAPTRSGKGAGVVVPTLLTWRHSVLVHDIKGENWQLTAGLRARLGPVLRFDPTDPTCDGFNPLMEIRRGDEEVRDAQNIADLLIDPDGAVERRDHWQKSAHALLVAAILHVLYAEPDKSLAGVARLLKDPQRDIEQTLVAMMNTPHRDGKPHPVVAGGARQALDKSHAERSGVVSTAHACLTLYEDPIVAAVTRRSSWRIADLVSGPKPTSLYLVVPPRDISRTRPLIRLMLNQICRQLPDDTKASRRRLLLLLDEFPALGRLDFFETALAYMAGQNVKALLVAQSLNQLDRAYGRDNAILDNCDVRIFFATNDERTARRISEASGEATYMRASTSYVGRLWPFRGRVSVTRQEVGRPLLTVGEVMQFPADEEILFVKGCPPIRAQKLRYYANRRLMRGVLPPPELPARPTSPALAWSSEAAAPPGASADAADAEAGSGAAPEAASPSDASAEPAAGGQTPGEGTSCDANSGDATSGDATTGDPTSGEGPLDAAEGRESSQADAPGADGSAGAAKRP